MPAHPATDPSSDAATELPLDLTAAIAPDGTDEPAPSNRAARRAGKRGKGGLPTVSDKARYQPPAHARSQQGRRINPVRRTGS
jgi:hypothetical protein